MELLRTFAEQAVIAIGSAETYRELQERTAALAAAQQRVRRADRTPVRHHRRAEGDVGLAGDAQPVFDLIVRRAHELCNARRIVRCSRYWTASCCIDTASAARARRSPRSIDSHVPDGADRATIVGRAILDSDLQSGTCAEPGLFEAVRDLGMRSIIGMPLLRDGAADRRHHRSTRRTGGFSDSQVELLKTFAEQAVIAISSAETYRELQARTAALAQRNSEYGERIEQQSATIDVLKAMSASPDDTQPYST